MFVVDKVEKWIDDGEKETKEMYTALRCKVNHDYAVSMVFVMLGFAVIMIGGMLSSISGLSILVVVEYTGIGMLLFGGLGIWVLRNWQYRKLKQRGG